MILEIDVTQLKYVDIVYEVMQRWYTKFAAATPKILVGILVFVIILMLSSYLSKLSVSLFHKLFPKSKTNSVVALIGFFKFLIILIGAFISFEIMGLGGLVLKFIGSLGVAGVIAGVALKDLVSSAFSGMLIGLDKAFAAGDYVTINNVSGVVEDIGFLTTKIITDEGKKVYVPNQLIFSAPFVNYSASAQRKIFIEFEIANKENLANVKKVIMDELQKFSFVDQPEQSEVIFKNQNLGIFHLEVRFKMKTGENLLAVRSEAIMQIKKRLDDEGIEMPLPAFPIDSQS
ncbi:mechanosensitive ion channel family protein [Chryseobacterium sp. MFBS3-17]|uniref:mechanosensitive ion channel family protein n=1 Tax=Chryseobacterium sp. MFBS3-17 TaxID=2886689 RepID=UPI001D0DF4A0|nr:mechanosensitive ion channel family protein [Chryseobacterium sp. MFBS3-17]MCC2590728.1 mechanosensitive ion channel family protein [Chryseobacterium sp. MFBS3-17]